MNTILKRILGASLALAAFSFITPSHVLAQTCVTPPTCESLGYTKTAADCEGHDFLKCPFDVNKLFCIESADNFSTCKTGSFLYPGGCSDTLFPVEISANTLVGIVFDTNKRLYLPIPRNSWSWGMIAWDSNSHLGSFTDIPLPKLSLEEALLDKNGEYNTSIIKESFITTIDSAASVSTPYLLAAGELEQNMPAVKKAVAETVNINLTGHTNWPSCIWSSTLAPDNSKVSSVGNGFAWALSSNNTLVSTLKSKRCATLSLQKY